MHLIISILLLLATLSLRSQNPDSVKSILPFLDGRARIDALNAAAFQFMLADKRDSAEYYQSLACTAAEKSHYTHGLAEAYSIYGQIQKYYFDNFPACEAYGMVAYKLYEQTPDKRNIEKLYDALWHTSFSQSKYEQSKNFAEKKFEWCQANNDKKGMADMYVVFAYIHLDLGQFDEAFVNVRKVMDLGAQGHNSPWFNALIGTLYRSIGDYSTALDFYRIYWDIAILSRQRFTKQTTANLWITTELAELYSLMGNYDSAKLCYEYTDTANSHIKDLRIYLASTADLYLATKDFRRALKNFEHVLPYNAQINDRSQLIRTELGIANCWIGLGDNRRAVSHAFNAVEISRAIHSKRYLMDSYKVMVSVYEGIGDREAANEYLRRYIGIKDSVEFDQLQGKMLATRYEDQLAALKRETILMNDVVQSKNQQLRQSNLIKSIVLACMLLVLLLVVVIVRNVRLKRRRAESDLKVEILESKEAHRQMQQKAADLEMAAMKAQMNPHFIFNCLNAINNYILNNDPDLASEYLTKFSRLIRLVLQSSRQKFVTLSDELEMLKIYIALEQMRFSRRFDLELTIGNEIATDKILIVPMLMQPFVENAIWHGLMPKKTNGLLKICITKVEEYLECIIEDNGVGRQKAALIKTKLAHKKSMGIDITSNRLKLMSNSHSQSGQMQIIDLYDGEGESAGTKVILKIPIFDNLSAKTEPQEIWTL